MSERYGSEWIEELVKSLKSLFQEKSGFTNREEFKKIKQELQEFSQLQAETERAKGAYSQVSMPGANEQREYIIPQRRDIQPLRERFIKAMGEYALLEGEPCPFKAYSGAYPTYEGMDKAQWNWYLYWRSQVRRGQYPQTSLSYIWIYCYELINGYGWTSPEEGFNRLKSLWMAYRGGFPEIDRKMYIWLLDFSLKNQVLFTLPQGENIKIPEERELRNVLIDICGQEEVLRLPFELIEGLCDYAIRESKFYQDDHQQLMQEAIVRVVSLADVFWRKRMGKGILKVYGPQRRMKQYHVYYVGAIYKEGLKRSECVVKEYLAFEALRSFITHLVKYTENILREVYSAKGRLRGMQVDQELAEQVSAFIKKEYDPAKTTVRPELTLDFAQIAKLREESDAVREALEVEDLAEEGETDQEVVVIDEAVTGGIPELVQALSDVQKHVLQAVLSQEDVTAKLEAISEENMSMPELLIDEVNELAGAYLDDIIIDTLGDEPVVLEQYVGALGSMLKQEEN